MTIGEKIKKLRKDKGLSQEVLAHQAEMNSNHLSRLERGLFQPSLEVLKRLVYTLNVSFDYLLSDDNGDSEVHIENKTLSERIKLLDQLDSYDQEALIRVIDSMLTKHRMRQLLEEKSVPIEV